MVRAALVDKNGMKKGAWSQEEDEKLRAYITRYGHWNWRQLPKFAGLSRCGKSCRLRWMNYLRPDVKHGNFSKEEEELIIQLHQQLGNKWSKIAAKLPGRTDNEIKNHWHTNLKKQKRKNIKIVPSDSSQCGASKGKSMEEADQTPFDHNSVAEESLPLSSQESSCSDLSSLSSDYGSVAGMNYVAEQDSLTSMEIFEELGSDFWSKPFLADNEEFISWDASYFDDVFIDWIHQELPEN